MTPVYQTTFYREGSAIYGNCLQACVASILDIEMEAVPHFNIFGNKWFEALLLFFSSKDCSFYGLVGAELKDLITSKPLTGIDGHVIAVGPSERGLQHSVLYKDGQMVHDPHPDGTGIKIDYFMVFEKNT